MIIDLGGSGVNDTQILGVSEVNFSFFFPYYASFLLPIMEKKLQINPKMNRFCLALDLVNDPILIDQYIKHHNNVWPEIIDSIKDSGILDMQIFHVADRLFMII